MWLSYGVDKFRRPFMPPNGYMVDFLEKAAHRTSGLYHDYIVHIVLPHAVIFAQLSRWGEVLVGLSLLLGLFARVGGLGGVLLALNYMPGNYAFWNYQIPLLQLPDAQVMAMSAVSLFISTGAVLGLDGNVQRLAARLTLRRASSR